MKRIALSSAISPMASGLLQGIVAGSLEAAAIAATFAFAFSLVFDVPAFILFRRARLRALWQAILGAAVLGVLFGLAVGAPFGFEGLYAASIVDALAFFATHGVIVSVVFWFCCTEAACARPTRRVPRRSHAVTPEDGVLRASGHLARVIPLRQSPYPGDRAMP